MNVEKLKRLQAQVRIGGKGTPRRKKKVVHQTATNDDKKLQSSLKKLSVSTIPGIEEVNIIKDDLTVIHFNNPKAQASLSANTFAVTGHGEHKKIVEMLPEILPQLGQETVVQLRMFANSMSSNSQKQQNAGAVGVVARGVVEEDDVPMLVSDFDEIAKVEAANDSKPAAPKQKSNDSLKALTIDTKPKNLNDGNAQKESNNNQKQSEGSVAEKLNINVASMPAAEKPIDTASAGKSQKEEQSDDGKANAKANKNSKGDNKSQPRAVKPTAAIKLTEDSTPIAVDQTQNIAAKSSKSVEQKATKDSDKKEVIEPVEGKQTKKVDKPKESKPNKKGQADKEGQQDKKKAQLEKAPLQIPETKEIETEIKRKKNQDHAMAVTPKEEERVQKQKSPLKGECKQNEEKIKQPPLQVQPQDVEKEIVQDTNVLELAKQQEPLKEAVLQVQTQDKKINETEKDENSITPKDIEIKQVVQQKTLKAHVMSTPGDTKQKTDAQKKGQAPKKEVTKKTETDNQKDQSAAQLTESTIDVVPQEHAPSKPKQQNKKKEKTPLKPTPVALENNKKDANVQPPYPDIQHEKGKKEQPKRREQSPILLKDIQKETCKEKEGQQVHALAKIEDISKVAETSVKLAAKPDNIKTIGNEQKNLFTNQPQPKQQTEHKHDESEPMANVVEALEAKDVRPSTNILEEMVKQVTDELKVMDTSKKVTDKSIEIVLPNEGLKSIPKTDDVEVSLVDAVVASKPAEVKQEAAKSSDECFKSSASVESQVTGLDMMTYHEAYHVPASKPAESKQEPSPSVESLKSSTLERNEVMELNVKQSADVLPAPKVTEVEEEPVKSVDEDLKSIPPELGQVKGLNMRPTEEVVSASKPAEAKQESIISVDDCLKSSTTEVIQVKEVDMISTADQVAAYETAEAKKELIRSGDQCLKSSTSELGQVERQNTTTMEDQVSANKPDEIKKGPIKSCDEGLKCSSPEVVQSKEVDMKPTVVQVQQKPGVELEPQPIKCDNKMGETAVPPQKDSPPRQNANKKNTTPQLQDKEGAKQHQNKQAGGGNKATLQSEGKKMEAAKPKQASPVKTHQQQQQQAGKQTGCNTSKQQQQVKAGPNKSPEKPVAAPKPTSAPTKSATPPKAVTPTKTMAATAAPSQPKKSPTGEDGGSSASIGKKQTQKEGGGNHKAKQTSPKLATAATGAAATTAAVVEGTAKQASPPKPTEQAAATPQIGQQPSAN